MVQELLGTVEVYLEVCTRGEQMEEEIVLNKNALIYAGFVFMLVILFFLLGYWLGWDISKQALQSQMDNLSSSCLIFI